jgi:serine-type D-Ala-D-Ala carboxypeptidase (penicillin-binding protein 5/6)
MKWEEFAHLRVSQQNQQNRIDAQGPIGPVPQTQQFIDTDTDAEANEKLQVSADSDTGADAETYTQPLAYTESEPVVGSEVNAGPEMYGESDISPQSDIGVRFAHLGAPRSYEAHEVVGNIRSSFPAQSQLLMHMDNTKNTKRPSSWNPFTALRAQASAPTVAGYAVWAVLLVVISVSVMASFTQGILLVKDRFFTPTDLNTADTQLTQSSDSGSGAGNGINTATGTSQSGEDRQLGSDDGYASSVASLNMEPLYKVANADQIASLGITAKGYYVADIKSGERIMSKNASDVFPIASVSKLMTALVAREKMDLQQVVVVSKDSYNAYGAQGELLPGEKIKLDDLMYPLLMESSNDGAEVIAESYGRVEFLAEMNKKAFALGMTDTYFEDPSGLNPKNVSSSEDLFTLIKYIKEHAPELYDKTRVREFAILKHKWFNKNRFLNSELFLGGKNGYIDESRWTTASLFDVTLAKGGKRQIGIVLLRSENREGDAMKLINFMQKNVLYTETGLF